MFVVIKGCTGLINKASEQKSSSSRGWCIQSASRSRSRNLEVSKCTRVSERHCVYEVVIIKISF